MVQKVETITTLIDDLEGTVIADGNGETVSFGLDGTIYNIDLTKANAKRLRDALKPYISSGRTTGRGTGKRASLGNSHKAELQTMREWANVNGYEISSRGRIPQAIQEAYRDSKRGSK